MLTTNLFINDSKGVLKMKKLCLSFVIFSVLFVIGCQENNITDPLSTESPKTLGVTNETADKNLLHDYKDYPDIIRFQQVVSLRNVPNIYFIVSGTIEVDFKIHNLFVDPINGTHRITVGLSMDAEMKEMEYGSDIWSIKKSTTNTVCLTNENGVSLTKYCKVKGRSDGMLLVCNFEVTLEGVAQQGMWITFPLVHSANNVAQ